MELPPEQNRRKSRAQAVNMHRKAWGKRAGCTMGKGCVRSLAGKRQKAVERYEKIAHGIQHRQGVKGGGPPDDRAARRKARQKQRAKTAENY